MIEFAQATLPYILRSQVTIPELSIGMYVFRRVAQIDRLI